jgi:hypothetical protein
MEKLIEPVDRFARKNRLESWQIIGSEVWCDRRVPGCAEYLSDIFSIYNDRGWHWAFYAYREDMDFTGYDYEMGEEPLPSSYWVEIDNGRDYYTLKEELRYDNPIWDVIRREFW